MKILVIGESPQHSAIVESGLTLAGFSDVSAFPAPERIADLVQQSAPDVLVLTFTQASRKLLSQISRLSGPLSLPVILFVEHSDNVSISAAVDGGIAAFVVNGLKEERVGVILALAIARFRSTEKIKGELDAAKCALKDRKTIDRAKGALMKAKGLDEAAAYALLRETAMRQSRKISDVAASLLSTLDLMQPTGKDR